MENNEKFGESEQKAKAPIYKKWWFWALVGFLVIAIIVGSSSGNVDNSGDQGSDPTTSSGEKENSGSNGNNDSNKATVGQTNALRSAKNYLRTMPFSKEGLKKQLEFEGYTESEALYGVNNCGANWKEQAEKAAKNYLKIMPFSRQELIDQLEFEGYTAEEARYGVEQAYK